MNAQVPEYTEDQRDCLQEVVNVAMGQAADSLARLLGVFVTLSVPRIEILKPGELRRTLTGFVDAEQASGTRQTFHNSGGRNALLGEALVVFADTQCHELAELLAYDGADLGGGAERELLLDIANILNGACLNGIAEQLGEEIDYAAPAILGEQVPVATLLDRETMDWEAALSVRINYRLENRSFRCGLLLLMPESAMRYLGDCIDGILADE